MTEENPVPDDVPISDIVKAYRKIREAIDLKEEDHKRQMEVLKEQLEVLSSAMLNVCNKQNADSIRTPAGTIIRTVKERFWSSDWGSMHDFIKEHDAVHLLEQRIHTSHMRQFLDENPNLMPEGLQTDRKFVISVRKPSAK